MAVIHEPNPAEIDADALILQAISGLCSRGIQQDKAAYFQQRAHVLVGGMVEHLMDTMPERPEVALLIWLLGPAGIPQDLASQVIGWAESVMGRGAPPCRQLQRLAPEALLSSPNAPDPPPAAEAAPVKSALKKKCIITPEGTYLQEEERKPAVTEEQKLQLIKHVPIFGGLDQSDIDALAKAFDVSTYVEGDEISPQRDSSAGMYIIASGTGRLLMSKEIGTVSSGDSFGDKELLQGVPVTETIEAVGGPLTTLRLDSLAFKALGLKRKIQTMHRKKVFKARDGSAVGDRRASVEGLKDRATNEEDLKMISEAVRSNPNLREVLTLSEEQIEFVSKESYIQHFEPGDKVMEKGEYGHRFYIVNSGVFEVSDADASVTNSLPTDVVVKQRYGDSFGELALLYNAPRAATVTCTRTGSLWVLSRTTFKNACRRKMEGRILEYSQLIGKVELLKNRTNQASLAMVCNALEERYFVRGERVVTEGDEADSFFVIFEGSCAVIVGGEEVSVLGRGDFFGERALLERDVRAATVCVTSDRCTVLALDRVAFELMMNDDADAEEADAEAADADGASPDKASEAPKPPKPASSGLNLSRVLNTKRFAEKLKMQVRSNRAKNSSAPEVSIIPMDRLRRIGVLGKGSFGFVSLERDCATDKLYALKAMCKAHIVREQLKDAVLNEKTCLELMSSDFVVGLVSSYRDERKVYLLLDPCFGGELFDVYAGRTELFGSEPHAIFYAACAALGLEHIHSRRIVYRDLKLENCLLTSVGYLKLTDLGISKVCIGKTYTVCGTTDYFAPETLRQHGHNRGVDWWALGVMIYIMMTGRSPFEASDTMKTYRKIMQGFGKVSFPQEFPEHCMGMIRALCQKKPEERLTMGSLGLQNYKDHPWYRGFVWHTLEHLTMVAPYEPNITEEQAIALAAKNPGLELEVEPDDLESELAIDADWDLTFDQGRLAQKEKEVNATK